MYTIDSFENGNVLTAEELNQLASGTIKGANKYVRLYPQCTDGYYSSSLSVTSSNSYECCALDVTHLLGTKIYLNVETNNAGYISLVDTSGNKLVHTTNNLTEIDIPNNASKLYISNYIKNKPDWYLEVVETPSTSSPYLFYCDFTKPSTIEKYLQYNSVKGTMTQGSGLVLNTGFSNAIIINKRIILNDFVLESNVVTKPTDNVWKEQIVMGARCLDGSSHGTVVQFDFVNKKVKIHQKNDGTSLSSTVLKTVDMTDELLNGYTDFKLIVQRKDAKIIAKIVNPANNVSVETISEPARSTSEGSVGYNSGGMSYDCPQMCVVAGSPVIKNFFATCKRNVNVLLLGDSITQGSRIVFENAWANKVIEYFGNSLQGGRGSGNIRNCVNNARSLMPIVRPKVLVVTIGTNNTTSVIAEQYLCFKALADYYGAILIVNTPWACDARSQCENMKTKIVSLNLNTCRFDLATKLGKVDSGKQDTQYFAEDNVHLNDLGNEVTYNYFINQFGYLKDNI